MHSIFWKIFLSFWFFLIVFAVSSAFVVSQFSKSIEPDSISIKLTKQIEKIIRQGGNNFALTEWLIEFQRQNKDSSIYIINSNGKDLLQRKLPLRLENVLKGQSENKVRSGFFGSFGPPPSLSGFQRPSSLPAIPGIIVKKITSEETESFTLLIDNKIIRNDYWHLLRPLGVGSRVTVAFILSGFICFFLARYLTIPLQKLRSATHQIASGSYKGLIHLVITDRKDEIGDLGRDFGRMAERVENVLSSQQRLLRDVSHELRSPLARLQIALELARQRSQGLIEPELDRIEREAERLNDLLSQTLSLARLSNQTTLMDKARLNLDELLDSVVANADYEAQNKQCHVILFSKKHYYLEGNWDLLHSALENILRNAVHYTKKNTTVEVNISLSNVNSHSGVTIKVRDYGSGVPDADIDHLFTPFFRVDEARSQHSGGYGIGLAIADRAIHLHQGKIVVANAEGGGLEVAIYIPILLS